MLTKTKKTRSNQKPNVSSWLEQETPRHIKALEAASRHFDKNDALDVHTLEGIYGKESRFGKTRGTRNSEFPAGDFQMLRKLAKDMGLRVSEKNDERFDLDSSSAAAAKSLKISDDRFRKTAVLKKGTETIAISDPGERKKFDLAAYHAGESRIATAQKLAKAAGDDPTKWSDVQKYLEQAGEKKKLADQTREYVTTVLQYEKEFRKGSKADAAAKYKKAEPIDHYPPGSHWITKDGRHILIKD